MIRVGIAGYGNLGRGVELALSQSADMTLCGVFTRRPERVQLHTPGVPVYPLADAKAHSDEFDVLILCGGSATDLPTMTPELAQYFNVVDSFDTHANIPEHIRLTEEAARLGGKTAVVSVGWDPGLFSLLRLYESVCLPNGCCETFWGPGVSQGHSDAIRRLPGVLDARQYTIPMEDAVAQVRTGAEATLQPGQKHWRDCYVVAAPDADQAAITQAIQSMPNYFADYETRVTFITAEEMAEKHAQFPHGGMVLRSGKTGWNKEHRQTMEFRLELASNPEFTAQILTAFARSAYRMQQMGQFGCKTILDIPPVLLSPLSPEEVYHGLV